ncbi:MAG: glycosyltransferase family 1 protein [Chitinophagales bacterium]|nr:glycosyltransferase family 1 protein [Chitinophagales bacterium]
MRIGINCLAIDPDYAGGVTSYTFGLLDGFVSVNKGHRFIIFVNNRNAYLFKKYESVANFSIVLITGYDSQFKRRVLWQMVKAKAKTLYGAFSYFFYNALSRRMSKEADIIYTPTTVSFPIYLNTLSMLSMHDIQQVHYPEFFTAMELKDRYITYNLSVENISFMQASSLHMKDDFLGYFKGLKESQVVVIPEGVDIPLFSEERDVAYLTQKYQIPEDFLFFPAQLWHHKNHITVLKALLKLRKEHQVSIPLVLTGSSYSASQFLFDFIEENKLDNVYYLGKVPFIDVVNLYQKASFLITAVLYESSSIPVLEAAASGTPVIASATRPNKELAENLKINLFEPLNEGELAQLLLQIWDDSALQQEQVSYNKANIHKYSWQSAATKYLDFFEKVVKTK